MTPTTLARANTLPLPLDLEPAGRPADEVERTGFDIGWDHAHHGLVPPAELLLECTPLGQGWRAGRAVFGARTLTASRATRQWLALRLLAWRGGITFETQQVTPHYLAQIHAERCPVLRTPLGGAAGQSDAAVIERLNPQAGYAAGNLALLSQRAARVRVGVDVLEALRRAHRVEAGGEAIDGLDAPAWMRLAALRSFATPLPFHEAAWLPLAALPPNRVRLLNTAQGLQALLTLQFANPGWAARTRAVAEWLPAHTLRHDYNLFIGALAPRVLEAGTQGPALRPALEDAWLHERVQRRWQHFVLSLGEVATASLLDRVVERGLAGGRLLSHGDEQATDGWGLGPDAQVPRVDATRTGIRCPTRRPVSLAHAAMGSASTPSASPGPTRTA